MVLEICVDSVDSAKAAQGGGADRVELCCDLLEGGVTPSAGLIAAVRESLSIAVFVMIRPRGGDFCYTAEEFAVMRRDIIAAKSQGVDGVVLGLLLEGATVDLERTRELISLARPMEVTFHRAIDQTSAIEEALEQVIEAGADRVLTSGGEPTAEQGRKTIAKLAARAGERIRVMACGKIRRENIGEIARHTGVSEFHAALRTQTKSPMIYRNPRLQLGASSTDEFVRYAVTEDEVSALRKAMKQ